VPNDTSSWVAFTQPFAVTNVKAIVNEGDCLLIVQYATIFVLPESQYARMAELSQWLMNSEKILTF